MPVGGIKQASQDVQKRREGGGGRWFKLADGESRVVRFLEGGDEIHWAWVHKMPPQGNQKWGDDVPCLSQGDQPEACPGCEEGIPKKFKGYINLIERDADKFATDENGKVDWSTVVGKEDGLAVWEQGITTFDELDGLDADYGLTTRDFKISRKGTELNTRYSVRPLDPTPMSEADKELAARKADLKPRIKPPGYDDMRKRLTGAPAPAGNGAPQGGGDVNPFLSD